MSRLIHWFQSLRLAPKAKPHGFRPRLEVLEDRTVMSTLMVLNTADSGAGSLRGAIAAAQSGDTVVFARSIHAITLTSGELDVNQSLDIVGPGAGKLTISGANASRVFAIASGNTLTLANLTVANGKEVVTVEGDGGGAILNAPRATLVLSNTVFANNHAVAGTLGVDVLGGAILNEGTLTIQSSSFSGNEALGGGSSTFISGSAGGAIDNFEGATLNIAGSHFKDNQAISAADGPGDFFCATGGAIEEDAGMASLFNDYPSTATITNSSFTNNTATGGFGVLSNGGGIDIESADGTTPRLATLNLVGCTVTGNRSVGGGGGDEITTGDSEGIGGGIMNTKGAMNIVNCTIANNQAVGGNRAVISATDPFAGSGFGGGISNNDSVFVSGNVNVPPVAIGSLVISNSIISGNIVRGGNTTLGPGGNALGGGISNSPDGFMTMTSCKVVGNQVLGGTGSVPSVPGNGNGGGGTGTVLGGFAFGGGVDTSNGSSSDTITDSVITGNSAVGGAGSSGNVGGNGYGGGLGVGWGTLLGYPSDGSTLTLIDSYVGGNRAQGGAASAGADGGEGLGGGLYIGLTASAALTDSQILSNHASGGAWVTHAGSNGDGIGGGVYNDGTFTDDQFSLLARNLASTSDDNFF